MSRNGVDIRGIILAGGDGTRLQSLTTRIEGDSRPKQFCRVLGGESLLAQTRRRITPLIDADKTITVLTKKHEIYYGREFNARSPGSFLIQPENRGTGVAIGAAILTLSKMAPDAIIAVLPSDHHYRDEGAFRDVLRASVEAVSENPSEIAVVGAEALYAETEYGWIEPSQNGMSRLPARVRRFWEKPDAETARALLKRGCLWNTFVMVGLVSAFIEMLCDAAPNVMFRLSAAIRDGDLQTCYRSLPSIDFSRDVLTPRSQRLLVVRDAVSGWTDLGNPDRVLATLLRERIVPAWWEPARDDSCGSIDVQSGARGL